MSARVFSGKAFQLGLKNKITASFCVIAQKIPRFVRKNFLAFVARLAWRVDRRAQRISSRNLSIAFPEQSRQWRELLARKSYINAVHNGADLLWLHETQSTIHNLEVMEQAVAKGRGVCLLTLHMGSWEALPFALKEKGYSISVLTNVPKSFNFLHQCYKKSNIPYICRKTSSTLIELVNACKKGEIICFFSDQFDRDVSVTFLGAETQAPAGGISLAIMMKAPVVIGWSWHDTKGKQHISFEPFDIEQAGSRAEDIQHNMQRVMLRLESLIRQYPEQWLWSYNRFKKVKN